MSENTGTIPSLTTNEMIEVDRAMVEDYGIDLARMMENAGRCLADLGVRRFLGGDPRGSRVSVLCGGGANGGGALAAARHLVNRGAEIEIALAQVAGKMSPEAARQLDILDRMAVKITGDGPPRPAPDLILDGLIGYGLKEAPRGAYADLIRWANGGAAPILAMDTPSGLDAGSGEVFAPAIMAAATLTLALPKKGLMTETAPAHTGELYLADIGVPPGLYARPPLNLEIGPIFAKQDIIRLR